MYSYLPSSVVYQVVVVLLVVVVCTGFYFLHRRHYIRLTLSIITVLILFLLPT